MGVILKSSSLIKFKVKYKLYKSYNIYNKTKQWQYKSQEALKMDTQAM